MCSEYRQPSAIVGAVAAFLLFYLGERVFHLDRIKLLAYKVLNTGGSPLPDKAKVAAVDA